MSPEVARRVVRLFRDISPPAKSDYQLTPQETELLKLMVEGHNYKAAAAKLGITINTVTRNRSNFRTRELPLSFVLLAVGVAAYLVFDRVRHRRTHLPGDLVTLRQFELFSSSAAAILSEFSDKESWRCHIFHYWS